MTGDTAGLREVAAQRRELLREAREDARRIVARAKQRTEELLNLLRESVQEAQDEELLHLLPSAQEQRPARSLL